MKEYIAGRMVWTFTLGHDLGIYGLRDLILDAGAGWEFGWLPDALRQSGWSDNMLFAGSLVGLAVAVALPSVAGLRGLLGALLSLPAGVLAGVASTPFALMWTWALMPALVPVVAGAFLWTVGGAAERGFLRGLGATIAWSVLVSAAFGAYAWWDTPPEANIAFYKKFGDTTLVAWDATTNLIGGAAIGFAAALVGGLGIVALFAPRQSKRRAGTQSAVHEDITWKGNWLED